MKTIQLYMLCSILIFEAISAQNCPQKPNCPKNGFWLSSFPVCDVGNYNLVFEDNFDGSSLDLSKWRLISCNIGATGNQSQEYNTLDNLTVGGGTCSIIAKKETVVKVPNSCDPLSSLTTFNYTSSNIWSTQKFSYGKYEIRCRMPSKKGYWPAFWLFGGPGWNELDIIDNLDGYGTWGSGVKHDFDGDGCAEECRSTLPTFDPITHTPIANFIPDFSQWHKFTCIFDFYKTTWLIDDTPYKTTYRFFNPTTQAPILCGDNIPYQGIYMMDQSYPLESMNIILNLAVRRGLEAPDANTSIGTFEIDYVRYYKRSDCCHDVATPEPCLVSCYPTSGQIQPITSGGMHNQAGWYVSNLNNVSNAKVEIFYPGGQSPIWSKIVQSSNGISNPIYWHGCAIVTSHGEKVLVGTAAGTYVYKLSLVNECEGKVFTGTLIKLSGVADACTSIPNYTYPSLPKIPKPCCLFDFNILNTTITGIGLQYAVGHNLVAGPAVNVSTGSTVTFNAGNEIQLLPGFEVFSGATFDASIVACAGFLKPQTALLDNYVNNYTDSYGDAQDVVSTNRIEPTSAIMNPINSSILVYPNPTTGKVVVELNSESVPLAIDKYFNLYDMTGFLIYSMKLTDKTSSINLGNETINNGTYYYNITIGGQRVKQERLVIIR